MKLTEHFNLEELTFSETAKTYGLNNKPNETEIQNLKIIAETLEKIRALFNEPIIIHSGFRSAVVNKKLYELLKKAEVKNSYHTKGMAVDFHVQNFSIETVYKMIKNSGIPFTELINEGSQIHLAVDKNNLKNEAFSDFSYSTKKK